MTLSRYLLATLMGVVFSSAVSAALVLSPAVVEVADVSQSATLSIMHDGEPLLRGEITRVVLGVYKFRDDVPESARGGTHFSDYSYMFEVKVHEDGSITLTPNANSLQIGKYELWVHTTYGKATGLVNAHLRNSIADQGPEAAIFKKTIYTPKLRDYLYGQVIAINLGTDSENTYSWYIDGKLHSSGLGLTSLNVWPEAGTHEISFVARNSAGDLVSEWSDTTRVSNEPVIKMSARKGSRVSFTAPQGYSRISWTYNGEIVSVNHPGPSETDIQAINFKKKGRHTVTCKARRPETGNFRLITWSVEVK